MVKKILIAESGSGYGGSAKYLASLLPLLDKNKFAVEVAAYARGPFILQIESLLTWPVHFFPGWRFPWGGKNALGIFQLPVLVPSIVSWLKKREIQIVHLNNEILTHIPLLIGARWAGCRVVCHLHGWRPFTRMERLFLSRVDEFVSISEAGAEYFSREMQGRKVTAIQNGISVNGKLDDFETKRDQTRKKLGIKSNETIAAIFGRLLPWKGIEVYLKALSLTLAKNPQLLGLVVGQDPDPKSTYLEHLKHKAQELGISGRVRFLGWQEDVWPLYAASDMVIHASTEPEPFGLVILEAMLAKKPVIATRGGGVADLVLDGETGTLVERGSETGLAAAIDRLVTDPAYAASLAGRGEERAKKVFSMEQNAGKIAALYDALVKTND